MTFVPAIVRCFLARYKKTDFFDDLVSGIMVGIVALPLAIAFAIASGVRPEQGIYTSIIAGFIIAVFGGSRYQISGPTGAFVVVVLSIVHEHGYTGLAVATMMAGVFLIILGFFRLGSLVKYMPRPVIIGFTSGIALIIFSTQIANLLGIHLPHSSNSFLTNYKEYFVHIYEVNIYSLLVSIIAILITVLMPYVSKKIPSTLFAIIFTTVICYFFHLPIDTIGSKFGNIPSLLPKPELPTVNFKLIQEMLPSAFAITLLGAVESLLSATVADGMAKTKHNSNAELIGQGIGNFVSPLFLGIPATGGIVRTAANIRFGGKTPVSAIIHSITLVCIMIFFSRLAAAIPLSALAGILVVVSWNMSEIHNFKKTLKTTRSDVLVLICTFLLTVLTDLTTAIEAGIILSALAVIQKTARATSFTIYKANNLNLELKLNAINILDNIEIIKINGALFFGSIDQFKDFINGIIIKNDNYEIIILDMENVNFIDASGIHEIESVYEDFNKLNIKLYICNLNKQPLNALRPHIRHFIKNRRVHKDILETIKHINNIKFEESI